jgi:hypothetical protein
MSELLQFGPHPDADQLSAFVERALPADERERTLAHLAVCPECRAVVALSLPPVDEPAKPLCEQARSRWFSGWNLAWSTATALAATIFFTVYVYHAATARNVPAQIATSRPAAPAAAPNRPAESVPAPPASLQGIGQLQGNAAASTRPSAGLAGKPQPIAPLTSSGRSSPALAAPSAAPGESRMAGGNFTAATSDAPVETSTQSAPLGVAGTLAPKESAAQTPPPGAQAPAEKNAAISTGIAIQAEAAVLKSAAPPEPVAVNANNATVETTSAAAGEVITGTQVRELPLSGENFVGLTCLNNGVASQQTQCPEVRLPSHLQAISTVAQERLVLAIDAHNAVFLSRDDGKRWKAVRAPWTGRAVKVALIATGSGRGPGSETATAGVVGALFSGKESLAGKAEGSLTGTVTDQTGAAISGASVAIANLATGAKQSVKTDSMGRYLVSGLAPGVYTVRATAPGFKEQVQTGVTVEAKRELAENLTLALGAVSEAVTVQADAVQVETTSAAVAEIIPSERKSAKSAASVPPPAVFEITTDSGERWTSVDGLTWTRR